MAQHNDIGKKGEILAETYLQAKGYRILERNYIFKKAEADIIAFDVHKNELVFVEVKTRTDLKGGYPEKAVSSKKRKLLFELADFYSYEKKMTEIPYRFDVLAVVLFPEDIYHIEDAFFQDRSIR